MSSVPVPEPLKSTISELFSPSVCCYLPENRRIREFVFRPPPSAIRLYCTLMRHEVEENCPPARAVENSVYVLYLEYMGGLVPILKGKRSSRLKTEFFIYDPEISRETRVRLPNLKNGSAIEKGRLVNGNRPNSASANFWNPSESESSDESFIFPYLTPKTRKRLRCRSAQLRRYLSRNHETTLEDTSLLGRRGSTISTNTSSVTVASSPCLTGPVMDDLPEQSKILCVTSNIWGTKFKFLSLSSMLPANLGSMRYRTSFLHLQVSKINLI